jgi:hypothetical protein
MTNADTDPLIIEIWPFVGHSDLVIGILHPGSFKAAKRRNNFDRTVHRKTSAACPAATDHATRARSQLG